MRPEHHATVKRSYPFALVPVEVERDALGGILLAAQLTDDPTRCELAEAILQDARRLDRSIFALREHRDILDGIHRSLDMYGTALPTLVRDELRNTEHQDALRVLPDVVTSVAPILAWPAYIARIERAAHGRAEWDRAQATQDALMETTS